MTYVEEIKILLKSRAKTIAQKRICMTLNFQSEQIISQTHLKFDIPNGVTTGESLPQQ